MDKKVALILTAVLGTAVLVGGCKTSPQKMPKPTAKKTTEAVPKTTQTKTYSASVKAGAKLYVQYACIRCHGPNGTGKIPNPVLGGNIPPLNHAPFSGSGGKTSIVSILTNGIILTNGASTGVINMPAWNGILTTTQLNQLADYIEVGTPNQKVAILPATTGKQIYTAYACVKCHGDYGKGGVKNVGAPKGFGDNFVPTLSAAKYAKDPTGYHDAIMKGSIIHDGFPQGANHTLLMPAWGHILSNAQFTALLNYLKTGH